MSPCRTELPAGLLRVGRDGAASLSDPPRRGAPLDIVVSDTVARHWIIERPAGLASMAELERYAADGFATLFGDDPVGWAIRIDAAPWAKRWLACALPLTLVAELPQAARQRGWRVRHLQSRLVREFNRLHRRCGNDTALCVAAAECTTLALIAAGQWRSVRVHPPLNHCAAGFAGLLARDCRQAGISADGLRPLVVGSLRKWAR